MLKAVTTFPDPGSYARLPGHKTPVRIMQNLPDGTVLVSGEGITGRRVPPSQLTAHHERRKGRR